MSRIVFLISISILVSSPGQVIAQNTAIETDCTTAPLPPSTTGTEIAFYGLISWWVDGPAAKPNSLIGLLPRWGPSCLVGTKTPRHHAVLKIVQASSFQWTGGALPTVGGSDKIFDIEYQTVTFALGNGVPPRGLQLVGFNLFSTDSILDQLRPRSSPSVRHTELDTNLLSGKLSTKLAARIQITDGQVTASASALCKGEPTRHLSQESPADNTCVPDGRMTASLADTTTTLLHNEPNDLIISFNDGLSTRKLYVSSSNDTPIRIEIGHQVEAAAEVRDSRCCDKNLPPHLFGYRLFYELDRAQGCEPYFHCMVPSGSGGTKCPQRLWTQ